MYSYLLICSILSCHLIHTPFPLFDLTFRNWKIKKSIFAGRNLVFSILGDCMTWSMQLITYSPNPNERLETNFYRFPMRTKVKESTFLTKWTQGLESPYLDFPLSIFCPPAVFLFFFMGNDFSVEEIKFHEWPYADKSRVKWCHFHWLALLTPAFLPLS